MNNNNKHPHGGFYHQHSRGTSNTIIRNLQFSRQLIVLSSLQQQESMRRSTTTTSNRGGNDNPMIMENKKLGHFNKKHWVGMVLPRLVEQGYHSLKQTMDKIIEDKFKISSRSSAFLQSNVKQEMVQYQQQENTAPVPSRKIMDNTFSKSISTTRSTSTRVNSRRRSLQKKKLDNSGKKNTKHSYRSTTTALDDANFEPVYHEIETCKFSVEGEIPYDLNGLYIRNGPNSKAKTNKDQHLFLGDGMVHGTWLKNGRAVKYMNRFVDLGTNNKCKSGCSNVSVVEHNSKLLSLGEFGPAYELRSSDLSTVGKFDFEGRGKVGPNISAHPKKGTDGNLYFFGCKFTCPPYLTYYCADHNGKIIANVPIALDAPKMIHDFMITENYVIFMDLPLVFNLSIENAWKLLFGKQTSILPFSFDHTRISRLGVMPKNGTNADITWFHIDTCYIFHTVNAYEEEGGDEIIFDTIQYKNGVNLSEILGLSHKAQLTRYHLNLKDGSAKEIALSDSFGEFPQINPSKLGRNYRFVYRCTYRTGHHQNNNMEEDTKQQQEHATNSSSNCDVIIKHDLLTNEEKYLALPENLVAGEFSFVEKKDAQKEDDGYLLGYVYDRETRTSSLMIFDTCTFSQIPIAKIDLGVRVPNGIHGAWIPEERLQQ